MITPAKLATVKHYSFLSATASVEEIKVESIDTW
jgi:hypothetical protein